MSNESYSTCTNCTLPQFRLKIIAPLQAARTEARLLRKRNTTMCRKECNCANLQSASLSPLAGTFIRYTYLLKSCNACDVRWFSRARELRENGKESIQ
jgi:hypothetical protein